MENPPKYSRVAASEEPKMGNQSGDHTTARGSRRYWVTLTLMISSFIAGILFAVGHHMYYTRLDDTIVGSAARQQWPIRFGTAFAFLVQVCFTNATGIAYAQWLWRRCRQRAIDIGSIDAAFAIDRNIFMFLKPNFILNFPIAGAIMVIFWCMPLSSLITPATLGVASKANSTLHTLPVDSPSISTIESTENKTYSSYSNGSKLRQILTIVGSTGELLRLRAPEGLQNVTYTIDYIMPLVRCKVSDDNVRDWTAAAAYETALTELNRSSNSIDAESFVFHAQNLTFESTVWTTGVNMSTGKDENKTRTQLGQIGYYATTGNTSVLTSVIPEYPWAVDVLPDYWIAIANPPKDTNVTEFGDIPGPYNVSYYTCTPQNASVTTNVAFVDNVQTLRAVDIQDLNFSRESVTLANYAWFTSSLYTVLDGFMMTYHPVGPGTGAYSEHWNTTVDETILGMAHDFWQMDTAWRHPDSLESEAEIQNKSFVTLFEDFALNASWSLMGMQAFSMKVPVQINQTLCVNKYTYDPQNLFIAYGCSTLTSLITVIVGVFAIYARGSSHDNHFSSISRAMQGPGITALFSAQSTPNASALEKKISKTKIRLVGREERKAERFRLEGEM